MTLKATAKRMRNAIEEIESALQALDTFDIDGLAELFDGAGEDIVINAAISVGEIRRLHRALAELTSIINDDAIFNEVQP
jgi:cell division GTPase FtsZ